MKFNYNRYQKSVVTKQSLKVDDGGLILKSAGSATDTDESGDAIDIALAEVQDELVNLVYQSPVTFGEFSNLTFAGLTKLNPAWSIDDRVVRMRGQSVGSDIDAVRYIEDSNSPSAVIQINKNAGTKATTQDIAEFSLVPAHKLIGSNQSIEMEFPINSNRLIDVNSTGFTMELEYPIMAARIPTFIKKLFKLDSGLSTASDTSCLISGDTNDVWIGEILDGYDTLDYKVWLNVSILDQSSGLYPVTGVAGDTDNTNMKIFSKKFTLVRVNDGGILFNSIKADTYSKYASDGRPMYVATASSVSYTTPLSTNLNVDELGLLDIWGYPSQRKKDVKKRRGYMTKKQLRKNLKELAQPLNAYGIDIVAIPYEEKLTEITKDDAMANIGPWISVVSELNQDGTTTEPVYYRDDNYSFMQRRYRTDDSGDDAFSNSIDAVSDFLFGDDYRQANMNDAIIASKKFKSVQQASADKYLSDLTTDDISPFTSSLHEVLVAKYGPANLLLDELNDIRESLMSITDDHGVLDDSFSSALSDIFTPDTFVELFDKINKNQCGDVVSRMGRYLDKMRTSAIAGSIFTAGASLLIYAFIDDLSDIHSRLKNWYKRAKRFEYYVGESVLNNGMSIGELNSDADRTPKLIDRGYYTRLPRYLVPVDYGSVKVKYRRKNWLGKVEVATRKKDLGIRWVELRFVNAFVYNLHRKSERITGLQVPDVYSAKSRLDWDIKSLTFEYTRTKGNDVFDVIDSINKLLKSDIPATLTLTNAQTEINPGTSIFFEIYDTSNVLPANRSKIAAIWNGVVLNSTQIAFIVPGSFVTILGVNVNVTNLIISRYVKPFPATKPNMNPINCQLEYKIPYLPTDTDIRDYVFNQYGPIDQSEFSMRWSEFKKLNAMGLGAGNVYSGESLANMLDAYYARYPRKTGFQIFRDTSDSINDMQSILDIHAKASFLFTILCDAFGVSRVKIIETVRSHDDQETLQVDGPASNFLSWHNYGLSIKINVYEPNSMVTIRDGSKDFFRLMKISEAFTDAALSGKLGAACNVVWCGRLKTGPNIFVWEFLPLGIDHRDVVKFRDAYFNQMDPFEVVNPINVDAAGYVKSSMPVSRITIPSTEVEIDSALSSLANSIDRDAASEDVLELLSDVDLLIEMTDDMQPAARLAEKTDAFRALSRLVNPHPTYIMKSSKAYVNAYVHSDGSHYVSPMNINNYPLSRNLILKDIQEYFYMIANKFKANGSKLKEDQRIVDWKLTNPISFGQMLMFYSLIGSYTVTRSLLAADYLSRYESLVSAANINPIKFVREFLGMKSYMDIKIYPDGLERDAGYITLHDGKLSVSVMQCRSIHPEGYTNMFGEHQSSFLTIEFGQVQDGVFIPEYNKDAKTGEVTKNPMQLIKSTSAVLSGYAPDGSVIGPMGYTLSNGEKLNMGDGYMLHVLIKDKILDELKVIREMFDGLKTEFLYDHFSNSPNQNHTIENEYGVIASQELMTFDELADVYNRITINTTNDTNTLGDKQGAGNTSGSVDGDDTYPVDPNRDQSVYEKLVSATQFTGIQFSRNTKEKPTIEPVQKSKLESIIKRLSGDKSPDVRDII